MIQIIITGLAGAVGSLAGMIFKMQNGRIENLEKQLAARDARIAEQDERDKQRLALQEAQTKTLQAVVDAGLERDRRRAQGLPEQTP